VTELEMAIFYLASFIFFLRLDSLPSKERRTSRILMCACFALAISLGGSSVAKIASRTRG